MWIVYTANHKPTFMKKILLFLTFLVFSANAFAQATAYPVNNIQQCSYEVFNLEIQTPLTLGNQPAAQFTVTYHLSEADAQNGTNAIPNPVSFIIGGYEKTIWIRVQNNSDGSFDVTSFQIIMTDGTYAPELDDVITCGSYTLPFLGANANYYYGQNGQGSGLPAGTVITSSTTIYIYVVDGVCTAQSSFTVTITGNGPAILPPNPIAQCDENGDGYEIFDIQVVLDAIAQTQGVTSVMIYQTLADAQNETNPVVDPAVYPSVALTQTLYIRANSNDCYSIVPLALIIYDCPTSNTISGHIAYDLDGNGCTENDVPAAGIWVYYTHDNAIYYAFTDANGDYQFDSVPNGASTVVVEDSNLYTASPASYSITLPGDASNTNFCLSPSAPVQDVMAYIWPLTNAVPGFGASYAIVIHNAGNQTVSGTVTAQFDASNLTYLPSDGFTLSGNVLSHDYTNLLASETRYYIFSVSVAQPPALNIGDVLTFTTQINPVAGDAYPANNTFVYDQAVVNSFDPNDITVREGEFINQEQADDYLHYIVRFQNTGNFQATNVRVEGMLDNNLDWDTFEPIGASHEFEAYREGSSIQFKFDNINLADSSSNEPASHGYVMYKVKPKATVTVGDSMSAQAGIYFDFNTAVITNTATTTIVTMAAETFGKEAFAVYPNPANNTVIIRLQDATVANVTITDVLAKTVKTLQMNTTEQSIDISALNTGVYFVTVQAGNTHSTQKLIINK